MRVRKSSPGVSLRGVPRHGLGVAVAAPELEDEPEDLLRDLASGEAVARGEGGVPRDARDGELAREDASEVGRRERP